MFCKSGISRAPTVLVTYFCLYGQEKVEKNVEAVADYLRGQHPQSCANKSVARKVITAKTSQKELTVKVESVTKSFKSSTPSRTNRLSQSPLMSPPRASIRNVDGENSEHFAIGETDINKISEDQVRKLCHELFEDTPITFLHKKGEHFKIQKEI